MVGHEVLLFPGVNATAKSSLSLQRRTGRVELMTTLRESPHPEVRVVPAVDVELSWLFRQLTPSLQIGFRIDRAESLGDFIGGDIVDIDRQPQL